MGGGGSGYYPVYISTGISQEDLNAEKEKTEMWRQSYADCKEAYDELKGKFELYKENSMKDSSRLETLVRQLEISLADAKAELSDLQQTYDACDTEVKRLRTVESKYLLLQESETRNLKVISDLKSLVQKRIEECNNLAKMYKCLNEAYSALENVVQHLEIS